MDAIDGTRRVRPGEELDVERLAQHLSKGTDDDLRDLSVEQFPSGNSNLTYLVRAGNREWVLRRPPFGSKVATAHDMGREFRILSKLAPVYPRVPQPVLFCDDETVLGAKFYLMERIRGVILRRDPPRVVNIDEATARRLSESFVDALVELHGIDYQAIGLGDLGNPRGYVERQVTGWTKRYRNSQTDEIPDVEAVAAWLVANLPSSGAPSIAHNDFKYDNLVLAPDDLTNVIGILDWELSTIGDPLMDIGTSLCYWVEERDSDPMKRIRMGPTTLPGMYTRREIVNRYAEKTGRNLSSIGFYYCFGLFKTAVLAQQIYYRYKQGLTKDERFADFISAVQILARQAVESTSKLGL